MIINLVFCNPVSYGGHVTFTVHLMRGLRKLGVEVRLFKVRPRSEAKTRDFGYGEQYRNVTLDDLKKLRRTGPVLITAPSKPQAPIIDELLRAGARIVIHDPAEFKHGWSVERGVKNGAIIIRKSMLKHLPTATFILHPYDRLCSKANPSPSKAGISISRIDFDKHTELLLDANRLLAKRDKIVIRGFENRIYTNFKIRPKYPEWVQSKAAYPKEIDYAMWLCWDAAFMFDMSVIKQDGGGTQYTFLEAMDAGAVCVLNKEWIMKSHVMVPGVNCLAVSSGEEIAALIKTWRSGQRWKQVRSIQAEGWKLLKKHDAATIAKQYVKTLEK